MTKYVKISYIFLIFIAASMIANLHAKMMESQEIANREREKKKKIKPKFRDGNTLTTMPFERLKKTKNELIKNGDGFTAIKYLEEMIKMCEDHAEKEQLMLELAGLWYDRQDYKHAQRVYADFEMLYPGSNQIGFVLVREIESGFKQILSADRDQSTTEETLVLIDRFFERKEIADEYVAMVNDIQEQCQRRLFDSEMDRVRFYLKSNNLKSAQRRLDAIEINDRYHHIIATDVTVIECKIHIAQIKNDPLMIAQLQLQLAERYPQSPQAVALIDKIPDLKIQVASLEKIKKPVPVVAAAESTTTTTDVL